ncbi:MAG: caspase family protein [Burkholderiaceae bacterium]|nr:caspase family protein [Burkholderiaceae bacterium]
MATKKRKVGAAGAMSLNIGLNTVSAAAYEGWTGPLAACEFDANDMAALARAQGMKASVLLTKKGTRANILGGIRSAAKSLHAGDLFFLTFSGHGGQVPDVTGDETDKQDETWCLYDGQLIDDELYFELSRFATGVRILVLSDSCHSGTVTRARLPLTDAVPGTARSKMMPLEVGRRVYAQHQPFYDKLQTEIANAAGKTGKTSVADPDAVLSNLSAGGGRISAIVRKFKAAVILISGCQDNQTSLDGDHNGAFTGQLLQVWNHGAFRGNYSSFHASIRAAMSSTQTPNLYLLGNVSRFVAQRPFTV